MWVKEMFSEDGGVSQTRVNTFLAFIVFFPTFTYVWSHLSLANNALQQVPEGVNWLLGVIFGAKVIQKGIEIAGQIFGKNEDKGVQP